MYETIALAPPDPILSLESAFQADPRPFKVNLGVGIYKTDKLQNHLLACVDTVQMQLATQHAPITYSAIEGCPLFRQEAAKMAGLKEAVSVQSVGGTGALRLGADFLAQFVTKSIILPQTTWSNHPAIAKQARFDTIKNYTYYDAGRKSLALDAMLSDLASCQPKTAVLLHASCHNPTGIDPTKAEWDAILALMQQKGLTAFFDLAYQGLGDGLEEDIYAIKRASELGLPVVVAQSFSKSFGLYGDRCGCLHIAAPAKFQEAMLSQLRLLVRANYSNPPWRGAAIVKTIMKDPTLKAAWHNELTAMRHRISHMREKLTKALNQHADFSFLGRQKGMFSFTGLSENQVSRLLQEAGIYMTKNGRINVAGLSDVNLDYVSEKIASVLA